MTQAVQVPKERALRPSHHHSHDFLFRYPESLLLTCFGTWAPRNMRIGREGSGAWLRTLCSKVGGSGSFNFLGVQGPSSKCGYGRYLYYCVVGPSRIVRPLGLG